MSDDRRGFSGLNALVSDVSDLPPVPAAPVRPAAAAGEEGSAWVCPPPPRKTWPVQEALVLLMLGVLAVTIFINWLSRPPLPSDEEKPPIANAHMLSHAQFRYCLSQEIRLKGAAEAAVETSASDMKRLDDLVDDFVARCGDAKYYVKGTAAIRKDVEANRHKLEREGIILLRFPSSPDGAGASHSRFVR